MDEIKFLENDRDYEYCPLCGVYWGIEEFDFQHCNCCGYPNPDNEVLNSNDIDDDDDDDDIDCVVRKLEPTEVKNG